MFGKWQGTSTLQGIALGSEKNWIRSRCGVPLGPESLTLTARGEGQWDEATPRF